MDAHSATLLHCAVSLPAFTAVYPVSVCQEYLLQNRLALQLAAVFPVTSYTNSPQGVLPQAAALNERQDPCPACVGNP